VTFFEFFFDGREHHLDDDRHFPERQRKQLFGVIAHLSMGERRRLDHLQRA
jgi:hypothetical protein